MIKITPSPSSSTNDDTVDAVDNVAVPVIVEFVAVAVSVIIVGGG